MGGFGAAPTASLARMFMHQISALCESPLSRHKLNLGLMRAGSPLVLALREGGAAGGREREQASEGARRSEEETIF